MSDAADDPGDAARGSTGENRGGSLRSLRTLTRRDLLDPFRSGEVWPVVVLFVALFGGAVVLQSRTPGTVRRPPPSLLQSVTGLVFALLPLVTLQFGYDRLAGPRETGGVRLLLAPPHSRRDLVLATFLGRAAFTGFAVGVSAGVENTGRAVVVAAVALVVTVLLWGSLPTAARYAAAGLQAPTGPPPTWAAAFGEASPTRAFLNLVQAVEPGASPRPVVTASPAGAVAVLTAWTVLPLAAGLARFRRADL